MDIAARWWSKAEQVALAGQSPESDTPESSTQAGPAASGTDATADADSARCELCFHACLVPAGKAGYCRVRAYDGQTLLSPYLGKFCSMAVDPIEKKPLHHWRPGTFIYSLGSLGCNMRCPFCQNHSIAQPDFAVPNRLPRLAEIPPHALVAKVRELGLHSVAYTYNEPALQAEYIIKTAPLLKEAGIATVLVSNGMYSKTLLRDLAPRVDAANIDLKCFNAKTYAGMGGSLETVMASIPSLLQAGTHVELTNLVVPGLTDSPEEFAAMADWIASISPDIPLHISRYFPANNYRQPPTPLPLLQSLAAIAKAKLRHVRVGNV